MFTFPPPHVHLPTPPHVHLPTHTCSPSHPPHMFTFPPPHVKPMWLTIWTRHSTTWPRWPCTTGRPMETWGTWLNGSTASWCWSHIYPAQPWNRSVDRWIQPSMNHISLENRPRCVESSTVQDVLWPIQVSSYRIDKASQPPDCILCMRYQSPISQSPRVADEA